MAKTEGSRYSERNTAALGDDRGRNAKAAATGFQFPLL
jgi:hypothetical protein